jgi:hypothetical protein
MPKNPKGSFEARDIGRLMANYPFTTGSIFGATGAVIINHTILRNTIVPQSYLKSAVITFSDPLASQYNDSPSENASNGKIRFKGGNGQGMFSGIKSDLAQFKREIRADLSHIKREVSTAWGEFSRSAKVAALEVDRGVVQPALGEGAASARVRLDSATNARNDR